MSADWRARASAAEAELELAIRARDSLALAVEKSEAALGVAQRELQMERQALAEEKQKNDRLMCRGFGICHRAEQAEADLAEARRERDQLVADCRETADRANLWETKAGIAEARIAELEAALEAKQ